MEPGRWLLVLGVGLVLVTTPASCSLDKLVNLPSLGPTDAPTDNEKFADISQSIVHAEKQNLPSDLRDSETKILDRDATTPEKQSESATSKSESENEITPDDSKMNNVESSVNSQLSQSDLEESEIEFNNRGPRLIVYYSTETRNQFLTTTVTALSTCFSVAAAACTGRRKRSIKEINELDDDLP